MKHMILIAALFLIGCQPVPINHLVGIPYIVPKGTHQVPSVPIAIPTNDVTFKITPNSGWNWEFENYDDWDWSKLGGIYWIDVHRTSIRATYRVAPNGLYQVGWHLYVNKVATVYNAPNKNLIWEGYTLPDEFIIRTAWINSSIDDEHKYHFLITVNDSTVKIPTDWISERPISVAGFSFPYVGGDNKAKTNWAMTIKIL